MRTERSTLRLLRALKVTFSRTRTEIERSHWQTGCRSGAMWRGWMFRPMELNFSGRTARSERRGETIQFAPGTGFRPDGITPGWTLTPRRAGQRMKWHVRRLGLRRTEF